MTLMIVLTSCKQESKETTQIEKIPGIVIENMDTTVSPKEDFYNYVNGNWMKNTEIPEDRTRWGGFSVLRKSTDADVLQILADAKKSGTYDASTDQAKALAIFDTKLDTAARNKAEISPLQPALDAIAGIQNLKDLQTVLAKNPSVNSPFFGLSVFADLNNSAMNAVYLGPAGLGLPERDYYLDDDEKSMEIRQEYKKHIVRMLQMLGDSKEAATAASEKILELETQLAEPRLNKVERRDARNLNNPRTVTEADAILSTIDLKKMIKDVGATKPFDTLFITQLAYTKTLNSFLKKTPIADLKTLIRWDTFNSAAGRLSTEIEKADWDFYSKYLRGAEKQRPADERALATVNGSVGEALGQLYVDAMEVSATKSYFDNMVAVNKWQQEDNFADIGEAVDKSAWGMSPQTVNAYFNPLNNEIVFPAAILQPPFYNYTADEAVNYGGIGAVIGHEISHAFDDSGSRFDSDGNLKNWWTDEDLTAFTERADSLAAQYDKVEVLPEVFVNGKFTLGENIGDLGGILGAYDGLQKHFAENGRPENIDGFTPEQRFFMSWATVWRTKIRDEALRFALFTCKISLKVTSII